MKPPQLTALDVKAALRERFQQPQYQIGFEVANVKAAIKDVESINVPKQG